MTLQPAAIADRLARLTPEQRAALKSQLAMGADGGSEADDRPIPRVLPAEGGLAPLTAAQRRIWFLDRLSPGHFAYNSPLPLRVSGVLDVPRLQMAVDGLVARHAALRTDILEVDGEPMQRVHAAMSVPIVVTDISGEPDDIRLETLDRRVADHARTHFDLSRGPLISVEFIHLGPSDGALLINVHHIVTDGWSVGVILRDLDALYHGVELPALKIQYADVGFWEADGRKEDASLGWWRETLEGMPRTELQTDRPRPLLPSFTGNAVSLSIAPMQARLMEALARRHGASAYTVFLAAFFLLLHRYTGQNDLAIGSVAANRNRREIEPLIGFFVNTLVMRQTIDPRQSFASLLDDVGQRTLAALDHSGIPFDRLVDALNPVREPSRNPLVQVALAVQSSIPSKAALGPAQVQLISSNYQATRFELELHLFPGENGGWNGALIYSSDLFEPASMVAFARRFERLLSDAVIRPQIPVSSLDMIDEDERALLENWSYGAAAGPFVSVPERFFAAALATPDAVALVQAGRSVSYGELARDVAALARWITARTEAEAVVGLIGYPSIAFVTAVLALWQAGRAFLPLPPDLPSERLKAVVEDAKPAILLVADPDLVTIDLGVPSFGLEIERDPAAETPQAVIFPQAQTLAYVIYTSGTTGRPKGVMVEHRGLSNLVDAQRDELEISPASRILQFASPSFDAFVFEICMAVGSRAALLLPVRGDSRERLDISARIKAGGATHVTVPPSLLAMLEPAGHPSLKVVVAAGETFPDGLDAWAAACRLYNAYGPTEATVWSSIERVFPGRHGRTIGRPIRGFRIDVLSPQGETLPAGIVGEMAIGGVGLARGYLGQAAMTAERFRSNAQDDGAGRHYLTGDRARFTWDGRIEFFGRTDRQMKIRGQRVEPAEIEETLRRHAAVAEAAVVATESLAAYVTLQSGARCDEAELRRHLAERLPAYMLPAGLTILDVMPHNSSGKLDFTALPKALPAADSEVLQGDSEPRVAAVFGEILGLKTVGRNDGFFELGGHSLLLLRLQKGLEREFRREVALAWIFINPTVSGIAAALSTSGENALSPLLIPFRREGGETPLFLVHPAIGTSLGYAALAQALPSDWPVHGLEAPMGGFVDLQTLAALHVAAIRTVQPKGPYRIGGWSLGGAVAFEIGRQLEDAGELVRLVLIDAGLPWRGDGPTVGSYLVLVAGLARELLRSTPTSMADIRDLAALAGAGGRAGLQSIAGIATEVWRRWPSLIALSQAWFNYRPGPFGGSVLVVRAVADLNDMRPDAIVATLRPYLSKEPVICRITASHMTVLGRKSVDALSRTIVAGLNKMETPQ